MRHWTLLGEAPIPGSKQLLNLYRDKDDFYIRISGGGELMSTRRHGSEDALGRIPCQRLGNAGSARVLVGGLGMGFTLAAALETLGPGAEVTVAELIPEVVEWNRGPLGECSGRPLDDPRTRVHEGDVAKLLQEKTGLFRRYRAGCGQRSRWPDPEFERLALFHGGYYRRPGSPGR